MPELESATIKHIALYPVKSCGRIELDQAMLTKTGLETLSGVPDHGLMIVRGIPDDQGVHKFITQRDFKSKTSRVEGVVIPAQGFNDLALIKPQLNNEGELLLTWDGQQPILVPSESDPSRELNVNIWLHTGPAIEVPTLSEWVTDWLNFDVRVISTTGPWDRMTRQNYLANNNPVRAQDGYPVHWFSQEDLDELSQKAGVTVPWTRFRPQIVVEGLPAQSVHQVFEGEIGGIPFVDAKPCDRCQIPQIDQDTGEITNIKPLSILKGYKKWVKNDGDIGYIFGENMLPQGEGIIVVGDEVLVNSHRNPVLAYGT